MLSIILLTNCDSPQCMKDYYTANQPRLAQIQTLSNTLADNYTFEKVTIKKKSGELEIGFWAEVGAASMYVNPSGLGLLSENPNSECSAEVMERFRTMYNDTTLREVLQLFEVIEPKAIKITQGGVFVALGQPLAHPNVNLNGGILMTFAPGYTNRKIVEEIDTNVYLYDALVY